MTSSGLWSLKFVLGGCRTIEIIVSDSLTTDSIVKDTRFRIVAVVGQTEFEVVF